MIFKTNDIRGIYPEELDEKICYRIGFFLPRLLKASTVLVGRDTRNSSPAVYDALCRGIIDSGTDVIDIGICDTPAVYFSSIHYGTEAAVMITASHNPPEYNGLKISGPEAVPIGRDSGLSDLEQMILETPVPGATPGIMRKQDIGKDYADYLKSFDGGIHGLRCVFDCGNGASGIFVERIFRGVDLDFTVLFSEPDGSFPNHGPDPLAEKNRKALKEAVSKEGADLGICFDGDGDRAIFLDEAGNFMSPDIITALIALYYRDRKAPGELKALYDIRSSMSVKEFIEGLGGGAEACPTGHARIKHLMKKKNCLWAGELAGHYYYRDNGFCDSAFITVIIVLSILSKSGKKLSEYSREINPYHFSGEINFFLNDIDGKIQQLGEVFDKGKKDHTDGLRVDFTDWWFIVRESSAEPVLRLVVEAREEKLMRDKVDLLTGLIGS